MYYQQSPICEAIILSEFFILFLFLLTSLSLSLAFSIGLTVTQTLTPSRCCTVVSKFLCVQSLSDANKKEEKHCQCHIKAQEDVKEKLMHCSSLSNRVESYNKHCPWKYDSASLSLWRGNAQSILEHTVMAGCSIVFTDKRAVCKTRQTLVWCCFVLPQIRRKKGHIFPSRNGD